MLKHLIISGYNVAVYEITSESITLLVNLLFEQYTFYVLPYSTYCFEIMNLKCKAISFIICLIFFSFDWNPGKTKFRFLSLQIPSLHSYIKTTYPSSDHHLKCTEFSFFSLFCSFCLIMGKLLTVTATLYIPQSHKNISVPFWFSGDGKNYTTSLSKRTYLNGKLDEGESYMVFQRAYLNVYLIVFPKIRPNPFLIFFIFFFLRRLMQILELQFKTSVLIT